MKIQIKKIFLIGVCICALSCDQNIFGASWPTYAPIPQRRLGNADYGTHVFPLLVAVLNTTGPILEMGCGNFSTPLLHTACAKNKRFLLSAETNADWLKLFTCFATDWHHLKIVPFTSEIEEQE